VICSSRKIARRRARASILAVAVGLLAPLAGCGSTSQRENALRPPSPIALSVKIDDERVSASPTRFGAGPVLIYVANQSRASHELTIEGPRLRQSSGPISPEDTATLRVKVQPGEHTISVDASTVKAARLTVGPQRPSGQDELLQP
jgi:hypothetical protein